MKKAIFIIAIILSSCEKEDVLRLEQEGYLSFSGQIVLSKTSKTPVPECMPFTPNKIKYRLLNSQGQAFVQESPITLNGNTVTATGEMTFPSGNYSVDEISLFSDNVITHTAPSELNQGIDFRDFVDNPLPYNITIAPAKTVNTTAELLCYSVDPIDIGPNWTGDSTILELITIYFYIPEGECINQVTLTVDAYRIVEWPIYETGLNSMPMPKEFNFANLIAYDENSAQLQNISFTEYNTDGILNENDILIFDNCN